MSYLDTSILVAYYCPEALSRKVQRALSRIDAPTISPLVEVELVSALALKMRTGELDEENASAIHEVFEQDLIAGRFCRVAVEHRHFATASQWIGQFAVPLRTMDALHLAVAHTRDLKLITADKQLASSAKHFKIACQWIH